MSANGNGPLLQLRVVVKHFPLGSGLPLSRSRGTVRAVDGVSFDVLPHETLSLVGESGCGKTTTARLVLRLEDVTSGEILYRGQPIHTVGGAGLRGYWRSVQAVFQDPWSSLNPRMRVGEIVGEPLLVVQGLKGATLKEAVAELFEAVGLDPATASNFPHEFSGGQRQRIAIARALALRPALIVLDEPVSALDVSIRAQVMNLLQDLQERFGMSYLMIAHDLATVRMLSHHVGVMYLGQIVELSESEELFTNPLHPYTQALIAAAAPTRLDEDEMVLLGGDVPSATNPPSGCRFRTRCPRAFDRCALEVPILQEARPGHLVACHLYH